MSNNIFESFDNSNENLRETILRYYSFWPYFLILVLSGILIAFIYLRYTPNLFRTNAIVEILDPAQESEMALPTELTVFNRSMINLENDINIFSSYTLHKKTVEELSANIRYLKIGNLKETEVTPESWFDDYDIEFKIDTDQVEASTVYEISISDRNLFISYFEKSDEEVINHSFNNLSTYEKNHDLPFNLRIKNIGNDQTSRKLIIQSVEMATDKFKRPSSFIVETAGLASDQLSISVVHQNSEIGELYLSTILKAFDLEGVSDRQLEYKRTIEFVNEREKILKAELEVIELRKQEFKKNKNLSDLSLDASNSINLKSSYNSELFSSESKSSVANYLLESMNIDGYNYLPINIGIEDFDLNQIILEYNNILTQRNKYLSAGGPNNVLVKSLEAQLNNIKENIANSLKSYLKSINLQIENLKNKELELQDIYQDVPENEKILRSVERELSIKEALYLLLLQKREEAAINLAVVKPTIKIIDYPITEKRPISPNVSRTYLLSILIASAIYFSVLYLWFLSDNKIHNKDGLMNLLVDEIPILCEIPHISINSELNNVVESNSRSTLAESIRMLISNLKFTDYSGKNDINNSKTILFTSSIKGEGKTLTSVNTAAIMASETNSKVILIGSDLRNPQMHKLFGVNKNDSKGVSEILYNKEIDTYEKYIKKFGNLNVLFSGSIPPNPTSLLASNSYKDMLNRIKKDFDTIIIDSAPCLLVSDTLQITDNVDQVVYMFRANHTDKKLVSYITELHKQFGNV